MKKVVGQIILALVLAGVGVACWIGGRLEARVADAHEELALLRYNAADEERTGIDEAMAYVRRVPWLGDSLANDVEAHRAAAEYWQARYDGLAPKRDDKGAIVEQEPAVLALAANATYRSGQRESGDRQAML